MQPKGTFERKSVIMEESKLLKNLYFSEQPYTMFYPQHPLEAGSLDNRQPLRWVLFIWGVSMSDLLRDPENRPDFADDVYEDDYEEWDEWEGEDDWLDVVTCQCRYCHCSNIVTGGLLTCSNCFHGEHQG